MNEVLNFLGLLNKGGKLVIGESILYARNGAYMLIANDSSEPSKRKFLDKAKSLGISYSLDFSKESLGGALGYNEISCVLLKDQKAAKALKDKINKKKGVTDI